MIKPGTLCLLVNGHELAGQVCTVTGYVPPQTVGRYLSMGYGQPERHGDYYTIAVDEPPGGDAIGWGATRSHLLPINDPDWKPELNELVDEVRIATLSMWTERMREHIATLEREKARLTRGR